MKKVLITPIDVFIFRGSRPFLKGESRVAKGAELTPIPLVGAIKTKFLSTKIGGAIPSDWYKDEKFKEIHKIIGIPPEKGDMEFYGAYLSTPDGCEILPTPRDVVMVEEKNNSEVTLLKPIEDKVFRISCEGVDELYALGDEKFYIRELTRFIKFPELMKYLRGEIPKIFLDLKEIISTERRTGIEIERGRRIAEEGLIYWVEYSRLRENFNFCVWVNNVFNLPEKGLLKIGGEGKAAFYSVKDWSPLSAPEIIKEINRTKHLKLYLSTPAIFKKDGKNVCFPSHEILEKKLGKSVKLKLISMAPGKPIQISGWDLLKGQQKPLRYAVRGGAVYFYKLDGEIDENLQMPIMISDVEPESGLGSAFIGAW